MTLVTAGYKYTFGKGAKTTSMLPATAPSRLVRGVHAQSPGTITGRKRAVVRRAYACGAWSSENFSIMHRMPCFCANASVSSQSCAFPTAQPRTDSRLPMSITGRGERERAARQRLAREDSRSGSGNGGHGALTRGDRDGRRLERDEQERAADAEAGHDLLDHARVLDGLDDDARAAERGERLARVRRGRVDVLLRAELARDRLLRGPGRHRGDAEAHRARDRDRDVPEAAGGARGEVSGCVAG